MSIYTTPKTKLRFGSALSALLGLLLLTATGAAAGKDGDAQPGGAFTCDFGLSSSGLPQDKIAPSIERDRMYMAARPGLLHKHIPISFDAKMNVFSGGRYLFDTAGHAREYRDWVFHTYVLDGVLFLKRPYFLSPECHAWTVIGAHDFADIHNSQGSTRGASIVALWAFEL